MDMHVDLGQVIVGGLLSLIIFQVRQFNMRLDRHETRINDLVDDVQKLIGQSLYWDQRTERRKQ